MLKSVLLDSHPRNRGFGWFLGSTVRGPCVGMEAKTAAYRSIYKIGDLHLLSGWLETRLKNLHLSLRQSDSLGPEVFPQLIVSGHLSIKLP